MTLNGHISSKIFLVLPPFYQETFLSGNFSWNAFEVVDHKVLKVQDHKSSEFKIDGLASFVFFNL